MNTLSACLFLIAGLIALWKSADWLVDGAVSLAGRLGVSPLIIGLTVIAMGTSAPEMAASITAAVQGAGDVAIGNVFGSNIANLALAGGVCVLIRPIRIRLTILLREIPVMLLSALLLWPVLVNEYLSRLEGCLLLTVFTALILLTIYIAKKENKRKSQAPQTEDVLDGALKSKLKTFKASAILIIIGLVGLAAGANLTVRGAVFIGERIGLSNAVIGLTIIAFGTSLPELATCVAAALKGHNDISIGNLVGSNVFNALLVTGTAGLIRPFAVTKRLAAGTDYWIMIIVTAAFIAMAIPKKRIGRTSGAILLCGYIGFMVYLFYFTPSL